MHHRRTSPRSLLFTVLLALCGAAAGLAVTSTPALAQDDAEARFERIIGDALRAYNESRFDAALDLYFEAKVLKDLAEIDYSIARTYHNLGQCDQAEKFYQKVQGRLDELPEGYEAKVDKYLTELPNTCIPKKEEPKVVEVVEPIKPVEPVQPPPQVDTPAEIDWVSIGIMGGGAAVMLAGLGVDLAGAGLVDEHKDLKTNPDSGTVEDRQRRIAELEDDIETQQIVVYALYGVGAAALVTGTVLLVINMSGDDADPGATSWQLEPALGPDGAGMSLSATW